MLKHYIGKMNKTELIPKTIHWKLNLFWRLDGQLSGFRHCGTHWHLFPGRIVAPGLQARRDVRSGRNQKMATDLASTIGNLGWWDPASNGNPRLRPAVPCDGAIEDQKTRRSGRREDGTPKFPALEESRWHEGRSKTGSGGGVMRALGASASGWLMHIA